MRAILLRLLLVFGLPFLLSGCKVVVWGYTNNSLGPQGYSRTRVGFGSTRRGLTLRIHVATSRHRALQASLNRAARAAEAARQQIGRAHV